MLADHGESLGEHGEYTHGVFLYDSTIRVPMLAAGPGIRPGTVVRQQVRSIDVFPTLAEFLGVESGGQTQGESLAPLLREGRPARTIYSYMETLYPKVTMGWSELRGVRTEEWKFVAAPRAELYRLKEDPSEDRDLATLHPAEAQRLQKRVWEIGVPGESVAFKPLDDQTRRELESLGYINASAPREVRLNMSGPDPKDRRRVLAGLERAAELMNRDRFQAALPLLRQALHEDPANPSIYSQLGFCYQRMERFEEALQTYEQMIARRLDTDQTFAEIGELRLRRGELEKAIKAMEEAARRNPSNLQNLVNLATAYLQTSRPVDAERLLTSILAQNSRHAGAYNLLGVLEISRERREQAKLYLEKAIQHDPDLTEAYLNLGLLAHEAGRTRQAASYFRSFLERAKDKQFREVIPKVKAALADLESGS
jgi:tetratricopeptide (TPR) repeat protein